MANDFDDAREHFCEQCKPVWDSAKAVLAEYLNGREALIRQLHLNFVHRNEQMAATVRGVVDQRRAALEVERESIEPWDETALAAMRLREQEIEWLHKFGESVGNELALQGEHVLLDDSGTQG